MCYCNSVLIDIWIYLFVGNFGFGLIFEKSPDFCCVASKSLVGYVSGIAFVSNIFFYQTGVGQYRES